MICPSCKNPNTQSHSICEWCGYNLGQSENPTSNSTSIAITVHFEGIWMIFDVNVKLYVDDTLIGKGSLKNGFNFEFNVSKSQPIIVIKHAFRSQKINIPKLEKGRKYEFILSYDRFLKGNFNGDPQKIIKT